MRSCRPLLHCRAELKQQRVALHKPWGSKKSRKKDYDHSQSVLQFPALLLATPLSLATSLGPTTSKMMCSQVNSAKKLAVAVCLVRDLAYSCGGRLIMLLSLLATKVWPVTTHCSRPLSSPRNSLHVRMFVLTLCVCVHDDCVCMCVRVCVCVCMCVSNNRDCMYCCYVTMSYMYVEQSWLFT